jgi:hypothetical protein
MLILVLKIFSPKIFAFFAKTTVIFCKHVIITFVFEKATIFFAENWKLIAENGDYIFDPSYNSS